MLSVGVKTLKNHLSHYLRAVKAGETVLVTDRDRVVAELRPPGSGATPQLSDAALAEAVREGYIVPALAHSASPPPCLPIEQSLAQTLEELGEDRAR